MPDDELLQRAQTRVGTTLKGKYHIDRVLGVGGMAIVYGATHRNKKKFAIKMLHPELSMGGDSKQRFLREGYVANTVEHPGAVAVLDDDVAEDGAAFIVMELLDGIAINELAEKRGGRLPPRAVLGIADQLLSVLEAAHAKEVVHRDLKPANLFLLRDGTVKVLDFGIARLRDAVASGPSGATQTGALMGTPAFLPPEQAGGRTREIDGQTDLWAVGATMFTLLCGEFIHVAENATQMIIAAATKPARSLGTTLPKPQTLIALVDRALAFDKSARWPNAAAMRAALQEVHRDLFGVAPSRDQLVELFSSTTTSALAVERTAALAQTPARPAVLELGVGGTTAQPVSSAPEPSSVALPKQSKRTAFIVVGSVAVVSLVSVLVMTLRTKPAPTASTLQDTPTTSSIASTQASAALHEIVAATTTPTATTSTASAASSISSAATSVATVRRTVKPATSTTSTATTATATATTDCSPPYYYDAQSVRHFKPECVK